VAEEKGGVIAAAWLRLTAGEHAVAADGEPELAIAARPNQRGLGIGSRLMDRLLAEAPFQAIRLSVRSTNPSVRLYRRYGFETVRSVVNRVGGESLVMRRAR
jgi:ribosomal protein S18 acetylase RimI-like enzyme